MKKLAIRLITLLTAALLTGCGSSFTPPEMSGQIKPVADLYIENNYKGVEPAAEKTEESVNVSDGMCVIEKKKSYYDVTLDLGKGSHREVGKAYAEAIKKICPTLSEYLEPYLFENIKNAFPELDSDYSGVQKRIDTLVASLEEDYREELEGFAEGMGGNERGFVEDGRMSVDEAKLMSLVPDALRPTACSAVSLNGTRTESGKRLNARLLDWDLGSDRQLTSAQCVVHVRDGERSYTAVSILGMLSILTAVNDDGLMIGEFDVGSSFSEEYICEGRTSYSFDLRHCLENFTSARDAGEYLVKRSEKYTFCVNVMLTDENEALCAELVCSGNEKDGHSQIREGSSKLCDGLLWDDPEVLCIVNSYAADGNFDGITGSANNIVRWKKYNKLFCTGERIGIDRFKELLTCEKQTDDIENFRCSSLVHMVIADYSDCTLQAVFAGSEEFVDTPEFIDLGSWNSGRGK